eukprot:11426901-Karenia_brevis.AAC.1
MHLESTIQKARISKIQKKKEEKNTHLTHGILNDQTKILLKAKHGGSVRITVTREDGQIGPTTTNGTLMAAAEEKWGNNWKDNDKGNEWK